MSDKLQGGIAAGSTSVSLPIVLRKTADNTEQTGVAFGSITAYYTRQGAAPVALTAASALGSATAAYAAGGWFEYDSTHVPGLYRLDVDNGAFATGADWVVISVKVGSDFVFYQMYPLTSNVIQSGNNYPGAAPGTANGAVLVNNLVPTNTLTAAFIAAIATAPVGSVAGAVGSVIGNVGGNVVGNIGGVTLQTLLDILQADAWIDKTTTPWNFVLIKKSTGTLGVGTELLRQKISDILGANLVAATQIPGSKVT